MPKNWRIAACLFFVCLAGALIFFRSTLLAMIGTWYSSRTFSHGFLVFPLSAYLVWRRRKLLTILQPAPNLRGLPLLAVLCLLWVLGNVGEVKLVEEWALVGILAALVWTLLGSAVVRALELPLVFLIFAVPFGLGMIGPLQDATAWFAVHALTLSGIPAVLENRVLSVPTATWTVAEACSGIRYLFSSVMLGAIYAWIVYRSRKRRLLFLCASVLVPILANGIRAYGVVLLAYLTNNRLAADVDHIVYGWLFFTVVQLALFVGGLRWRQTSSRAEMCISKIATAGAAPPLFSGKLPFIVAAVTVILLGLTPALAERLWNRAATNAEWSQWPEPPVSVSLPWLPAPTFDTSWAPDLRTRNRDFVQSYIAGQHRVDLYWALYSGGHGFELLNSYNRVSNPKVWAPVAEGFEYQIVDGGRIKVRRSLIQSGAGSRFVWTWYCVSGEYTGSSTRVKLLQMKARLMGTSPTTIVLALGTDSLGERSAAEAVLQDFLSHASFLKGPSPSLVPQAAGGVQSELTDVHNVSH